MVTFVFSSILLMSIAVITLFDLVIYDHSPFSILINNLLFEPGTSQWMLYVNILVGFIYSIGVDYRIRRKNKSSKSS